MRAEAIRGKEENKHQLSLDVTDRQQHEDQRPDANRLRKVDSWARKELKLISGRHQTEQDTVRSILTEKATVRKGNDPEHEPSPAAGLRRWWAQEEKRPVLIVN